MHPGMQILALGGPKHPAAMSQIKASPSAWHSLSGVHGDWMNRPSSCPSRLRAGILQQSV